MYSSGSGELMKTVRGFGGGLVPSKSLEMSKFWIRDHTEGFGWSAIVGGDDDGGGPATATGAAYERVRVEARQRTHSLSRSRICAGQEIQVVRNATCPNVAPLTEQTNSNNWCLVGTCPVFSLTLPDSVICLSSSRARPDPELIIRNVGRNT